MTLIAEIVVALVLVAGGLFAAVGAWGLVRLPDPMTRLHGPTKAATLGVGSVLIGSMLYFWSRGDFTWHELLIALFLFITAPLTGLFLSKANMLLLWRKQDLPRTGTGEDWATYAPGREGRGGEDAPSEGQWRE